jgi:hypothetical protein
MCAVRLLKFLGYILLGVLVANIIGLIYFKLETGGLFVRWELLESTIKPQHIILSNADSVFVLGEDAKYYSYKHSSCENMSNPVCYQWVKASTSYNFDSGLQNYSGCDPDVGFEDFSGKRIEHKYPPTNVAPPTECRFVYQLKPDGFEKTTVYYVLLANGELWMWKQTVGALEWLPIILIASFLGFIVGGVIGLRSIGSSNNYAE